MVSLNKGELKQLIKHVERLDDTVTRLTLEMAELHKKLADKVCQCCENVEARPLHTCPYSQELSDGKDNSLCNCCEWCEEQCALDI